MAVEHGCPSDTHSEPGFVVVLRAKHSDTPFGFDDDLRNRSIVDAAGEAKALCPLVVVEGGRRVVGVVVVGTTEYNEFHFFKFCGVKDVVASFHAGGACGLSHFGMRVGRAAAVGESAVEGGDSACFIEVTVVEVAASGEAAVGAFEVEGANCDGTIDVGIFLGEWFAYDVVAKGVAGIGAKA